MAEELLDYSDEVCEELLAVLREYLPAALLTVAADKRPPAVQTWHTASVALVATNEKLPCVTVTDEPPGGVELKFLGTGVPPGDLPTMQGTYTVYCAYVMDYKPTERAMSQVRKARAHIATILAKHARNDLGLATGGTPVVNWKQGPTPLRGRSGGGTVERLNAPPGTYVYGVVTFTCWASAGPN